MLEGKGNSRGFWSSGPFFPCHFSSLLSSCTFPISQAGIHKIRKGKLMGHYSTTSVYISMKQHVPSSTTYASQDRYFRIRNFHQLISVYVLTTRVAKCMRYYRLSIVLKIINYKVNFPEFLMPLQQAIQYLNFQNICIYIYEDSFFFWKWQEPIEEGSKKEGNQCGTAQNWLLKQTSSQK